MDDNEKRLRTPSHQFYGLVSFDDDPTPEELYVHTDSERRDAIKRDLAKIGFRSAESTDHSEAQS